MRLPCSLIALLWIVACADVTPDDQADGEAETGAEQAVGKADGASFAGVYRTHAATLRDGDVPSLELSVHTVPGLPVTYAYVRARCYHASCSRNVPETDTYSVYTSSAGKTYVRFWSFTVTVDPNNGPTAHPVIADVYEIKAFSGGVKLRKSYSTSWQTLYCATDASVCQVSHGTWASSGCACPGTGTEFVRGAGGCIDSPGASESNCDATNGLWTDDEATLIGSYCECGLGRYVDSAGSCTSL